MEDRGLNHTENWFRTKRPLVISIMTLHKLSTFTVMKTESFAYWLNNVFASTYMKSASTTYYSPTIRRFFLTQSIII